MGDDDALGAGGGNGLLQAGPVGVVAHDEAAVHPAPPPRAAHLHPARGKGIRVVAKAPQPQRAGGRGRRDDQRAGQRGLVDAGVGHQLRGRQRHAFGAVGGVEWLDGAVADQRADAGVGTVQDALRLAKGVGVDDGAAPGRRVGLPPGVDFGHQRGLRLPAVDRQAEGGFGDEHVAAHRLEGRAGAIVLQLVVARGDPDLAAVLQPHLRRAEHVARRVQRQAHAVHVDPLAVGQRLQTDVSAQPRAQHAGALRLRQIRAVPAPRMIAVRVRDDGARHRLPRVDVEVARRAVQPLGALHDQVARGGVGGDGVLHGEKPAAAPQRGAGGQMPSIACRPGHGCRTSGRHRRHQAAGAPVPHPLVSLPMGTLPTGCHASDFIDCYGQESLQCTPFPM